MNRDTIIDAINTYKRRHPILTDPKEIDSELLSSSLLLYHLTTSGLNYYVVKIDKDFEDSTDLGGLLEGAFIDLHDSIDNDSFDSNIYVLMGAIKEEELDEDQKKYEEYSYLDLGYVLNGLIDVAEVIKNKDIKEIYYGI